MLSFSWIVMEFFRQPFLSSHNHNLSNEVIGISIYVVYLVGK